MRKLSLFTCAFLAAAVVGFAQAAKPNAGTLYVEDGKGVVALDLRGSVLGRLALGTLRVTDSTPRDQFTALVVGRKLVSERVGPRTVLYRGQGLRFRMVGGRYKIVVRGTGISLSAVGRGAVVLDGERRAEEDAGVYSLDGVDCAMEPALCTPLPDEPERFVLGPPDESEARAAP